MPEGKEQTVVIVAVACAAALLACLVTAALGVAITFLFGIDLFWWI
jgi:hypothetical protein